VSSPSPRRRALAALFVAAAAILAPTLGAQAHIHEPDEAREHGLFLELAKPLHDDLTAAGVNVGLIYTGEALTVLTGGRERGDVWLDNVDLLAGLDLKRLRDWEGASAQIYGIGNHGRAPSAAVGDLRGSSNLEAPSGWRLYEVWVEQQLARGAASLKLGLYGVDTEFQIIETAAMSPHSSAGVSAAFGIAGRNGPSIFPFTGPGVRLWAGSEKDWYGQAAVTDGVPGELGDPHGVKVHLRTGEGLFAIAEAGYRSTEDHDRGAFTKAAVGMWEFTEPAPRLVDPGETRRRGGYLLAERQLSQESGAPEQGLAAFERASAATAAVNVFSSSLETGVLYRGPLPGRDGDRVGVLVAHARGSSAFRATLAATGVPTTAAETVVELSYRAQMLPWLTVQPLVQRVLDPGLDSRLGDAWIAGLRVSTNF